VPTNGSTVSDRMCRGGLSIDGGKRFKMQ
jgi:hypothetical protein